MKRNIAICSTLALLAVSMLAGCDSAPETPKPAAPIASGGPPPPPPAPPASAASDKQSSPPVAADPMKADGSGGAVAADAAAAGTAPPKAADDGNMQKAEVGVGKRGRDYEAGFVTTPIQSYFLIQDRIKFMMLEKAMNDFKMLNNRDPKSQAEFDQKIMKENSISLPELPDGDTYQYDPESGQLMVKHPKK